MMYHLLLASPGSPKNAANAPNDLAKSPAPRHLAVSGKPLYPQKVRTHGDLGSPDRWCQCPTTSLKHWTDMSKRAPPVAVPNDEADEQCKDKRDLSITPPPSSPPLANTLLIAVWTPCPEAALGDSPQNWSQSQKDHQGSPHAVTSSSSCLKPPHLPPSRLPLPGQALPPEPARVRPLQLLSPPRQ